MDLGGEGSVQRYRMSLRMLVCIDDSPHSQAAGRVAVDLASRLRGAHLTAVHVVNVHSGTGSFLKDLPGRLGFEPAVVSADLEERYVERANELLAAFAESAAAQGVEVKTVVERGAVLDRILHRAHHADLLIIGNLGETAERFPGQGGNNVYNLVAGAPCPVLIVPQSAEPLRSVVLGYDGSKAAMRAIAALRHLTDSGELTVHALLVEHGQGADPKVLDEVEEHLPGTTVIPRVMNASIVRDGIVRVARDTDANVLAIGFAGRSKLRDFLYGSTADYLLTDRSLMLLISH